MRPGTLTRFIKRKLYDKIDLKIRPNSVYSKEYILDFLIHTATLNNPTITNGARFFDKTCRDRIIHPNTIFYHLYKLKYEEIEETSKKANKELLKLAKKIIGREEVEIAIDSTDWLYYGKEVPGVVRVQPREGTSKGFKFMTVNIVEAGLRFTVAIKPAVKNSKVKKLIEQYNAPTIVRYKMERRDGKAVYFNLFIVESEDEQKIVLASNYSYYYKSIILRSTGKDGELKLLIELRTNSKPVRGSTSLGFSCSSCLFCCTTPGFF